VGELVVEAGASDTGGGDIRRVVGALTARGDRAHCGGEIDDGPHLRERGAQQVFVFEQLVGLVGRDHLAQFVNADAGIEWQCATMRQRIAVQFAIELFAGSAR
jgi:hypothetical protein